jgi:hypothetical protein
MKVAEIHHYLVVSKGVLDIENNKRLPGTELLRKRRVASLNKCKEISFFVNDVIIPTLLGEKSTVDKKEAALSLVGASSVFFLKDRYLGSFISQQHQEKSIYTKYMTVLKDLIKTKRLRSFERIADIANAWTIPMISMHLLSSLCSKTNSVAAIKPLLRKFKLSQDEIVRKTGPIAKCCEKGLLDVALKIEKQYALRSYRIKNDAWWVRLLAVACKNGHIEMARWIFETYGSSSIDIGEKTKILCNLCCRGNVSSVVWFCVAMKMECRDADRRILANQIGRIDDEETREKAVASFIAHFGTIDRIEPRFDSTRQFGGGNKMVVIRNACISFQRLKSVLPENIKNIVATTNYGCEIHLRDAASCFPDVKFSSKPKCLVFKLNKPKATVMVFGSGRAISVGTKRDVDCRASFDVIRNKFFEIGYVFEATEPKLCNVLIVDTI